MKILKSIGHLIEKIDTWVQVGITVILFFILGVTLYGVIMRYAFHAPPQWSSQILILLFIPVAVMGGGYVYLKDSHVRLDLIYSRLSTKGQAIINTISFLPFLLLTGILAKVTIQAAWRSTAMREVYTEFIFKGPVYPKKIALAIGVVLLLLTGVLLFIRNVRTIIDKSKKKDIDKDEH